MPSDFLAFKVPSLAIAQGELARFSRTRRLLHLAHATRALEETLRELDAVRQEAIAAKQLDSYD